MTKKATAKKKPATKKSPAKKTTGRKAPVARKQRATQSEMIERRTSELISSIHKLPNVTTEFASAASLAIASLISGLIDSAKS